MEFVKFAFNPLQENTYVVWDESLECVVIDAGNASAKEDRMLAEFIAGKGLKPVLAVNTHGHFDHAMGVQFVKDTYAVPFALSSADKVLMEQGVAHAMMFGLDAPNMPSEVEVDLATTDVVRFGNTELKVIPSPGHTPGGVVLYHEPSGTLFTGDTLFKGSIGRTDLPGGDYTALMHSILNNIIPLGDEVKVCPGHGESSTIGQESLYNPFVTEALNGEVNYK
ncbi:MAG: MBL fold metallo-hydrolase [Alistipes sp.]|nr:MBL fold metallo-hydrolase [Alistipes sp.]